MKKTILYAVCAVAVIAAAAFVIVGCDGDMGERSDSMDAFLDWFHYNKQKVKKFTVTYDGNGNSSGNAPIDTLSPYDSGKTVFVMEIGTLKNGDLKFLRWNTKADGSGDGYAAGTGSFEITDTVILYALWGEGKLYDVTLTSSMTVTNASGSASYRQGETVRINAGTPPTGWEFHKWTVVSGEKVFIADTMSAITTFAMPENNVTVKAWFMATDGTDGWFTDERDSVKYRMVTIVEQTWMAQNLNYLTSDSSWCYNDDPDNCIKYGRLYAWNVARTACPSGWRLPTREEWGELAIAVGGTGDYGKGGGMAGKRLKSTSGWDNNGNGTDDLGFTGLPGGIRSNKGEFLRKGRYGTWWTDTEYGQVPYGRTMVSENGNLDEHYYDDNCQSKRCGSSVRCIKND